MMKTHILLYLLLNSLSPGLGIFRGLPFTYFYNQKFVPSLSDQEISNEINVVHKTPKVPEFSLYYVTSGILRIPYAEIEEPFNAWVDFSKRRSRIDYYGGIMKTYQLGDALEYGTMLKVAPMTNEVVENILTCFQVNGSSDFKVNAQRMIPDLTNYEYVTDTVMNGVSVQEFQMTKKEGSKQSQYTIWIGYQGGLKGHENIPVPIRYEMKGYNSLLGSHYDHYILDYNSYSIEIPSDEVFKTDSSLTCRSFPGPGIRDAEHRTLMNPISEYLHGDDSHISTHFERFKGIHGKYYEGAKEELLRATIFKHNFRFIQSFNRKGLSYKLNVNHLADRTPEEVSVLRGRRPHKGSNDGQLFKYSGEDVLNAPEYIDWRLYGAVTPVKDQSVCGSCWSFGTTGTIEGALFLKTGSLVRLSQQSLIDCSWGMGNNGCDGGEDFRAYKWMMAHGGIPTADSYGPYMGIDGFCHSENSTRVAITGFVNVTSGDQQALKVALFLHGPISVAIDASPRTFTFYSHGVYYDDHCKNGQDDLDHAVLLVGYGNLDGENYWLIKNSWSTYWGNDGYILISQKKNICGVATTPTFVTL